MNAVEESATGHYRTAAAAIAFVGCVGLGMGAIAASTSAELGFINLNALLSFSVLFLVVAAMMCAYRES